MGSRAHCSQAQSSGWVACWLGALSTCQRPKSIDRFSDSVFWHGAGLGLYLSTTLGYKCTRETLCMTHRHNTLACGLSLLPPHPPLWPKLVQSQDCSNSPQYEFLEHRTLGRQQSTGSSSSQDKMKTILRENWVSLMSDLIIQRAGAG